MTDLIPISPVDLSQSVQDATGQLSKRSRRIYEHDARVFAGWITDQGLAVEQLTRSTMIAYRKHLGDIYEPATASRMLSVARRLLNEQVLSGKILANPLGSVKGFKLGSETPHTALTKEQAKELLAVIDKGTLLGLRDYALISLLLRTGIRRSECAALNIGDLSMEQGHHIATIEHGKGDKRRVVKLPVDVFRAIEDYIEAVKRRNVSPGSPLFVGTRQGQRISDKLIERRVKFYGGKIGVAELTPHGLRATFITLAIEGGATLTQAQYAAGHSDPRTTERYQRRKLNLDDNAVDYIKL